MLNSRLPDLNLPQARICRNIEASTLERRASAFAVPRATMVHYEVTMLSNKERGPDKATLLKAGNKYKFVGYGTLGAARAALHGNVNRFPPRMTDGSAVWALLLDAQDNFVSVLYCRSFSYTYAADRRLSDTPLHSDPARRNRILGHTITVGDAGVVALDNKANTEKRVLYHNNAVMLKFDLTDDDGDEKPKGDDKSEKSAKDEVKKRDRDDGDDSGPSSKRVDVDLSKDDA